MMTETSDYRAARQSIVEYLKSEIVGPRDGEHETLTEAPARRYMAGILYPQDSSTQSVMEEQEEDSTGTSAGTESSDITEVMSDDPVSLANQYLPSSMGLSFFLTGSPEFRVALTAAIYVKEESDTGSRGNGRRMAWKRKPLRQALGEDWLVIRQTNQRRSENYSVFDGRARINVIWRPAGNGWITTVTAINDSVNEEGSSPAPEKCLYQVQLRCCPTERSNISDYPRAELLSDDLEESILELLYRDQRVFGTGHGCSVEWMPSSGLGASEVWTAVIPSYELSPISYDLPGHEEVLRLNLLAAADRNADTHSHLMQLLRNFVSDYEVWISSLESYDGVPSNLSKVKSVVIERLRTAAARMNAGLELLRTDREVLHAFCMANRAMLLQMIHSGENFGGRRKTVDEARYVRPDIENASDYRWRPFQLAFQLLSISSVANGDDPDRATVDLIWFPTGGGKTEAYLSMAAFIIFYRRIRYGVAGGGTSILMRYTLRLLTTQQFKRASTLICACEHLRKENTDVLGCGGGISIGLWVGSGTTPNSYKQAKRKLDEILEADEPESPFQIENCPWCGTELVPTRHNEDRTRYGIRASEYAFSLFCPNAECEFHDELPIKVIDEQMYNDPPSLLLATVDKFAHIAWDERVSAFFGNETIRPPELIIQDELHLISGPLGTMVGLYETAIDALASRNGTPPKIIASAATVRRADDQCKGLFARSVQLFPPSGLNASDSYFSRADDSRSGRLYVGVMTPGYTGSTAMVRTSAALLQAPVDLGLEGDTYDAYSTLVAYHNSLRELGKSMTFALDDIPARMKVIARDGARIRSLDSSRVEELTSNVDGSKLIGVLNRLELRWDDPGSISCLMCTNMLSVGVDVSRLGLMLVNGQPKSTSEYIQSTSRVGRGDAPGLVVCLYSPTKPRDRSHFERFLAYHSTLYQQVEPTSVTPFAKPARERALHAVLVALVRHYLGLNGNEDASRFSEGLQGFDDVRDILVRRVQSIDPDELQTTVASIDDLVSQWSGRAAEDRIVYSSPNRAQNSLIRDVYQSGDGWPTLRSMRNVDRSCRIKVLGE